MLLASCKTTKTLPDSIFLRGQQHLIGILQEALSSQIQHEIYVPGTGDGNSSCTILCEKHICLFCTGALPLSSPEKYPGLGQVGEEEIHLSL